MAQYFKITVIKSDKTLQLQNPVVIGTDDGQSENKTMKFVRNGYKSGLIKFQKDTIITSLYCKKDGNEYVGYTVLLTSPEKGRRGTHPWNVFGETENDWESKIQKILSKGKSPDTDLQHAPASTECNEKKVQQTKALSPDQLDPMPEFSGSEGMRKMYELAKGIFDQVQKDENKDLWKYVIGYPILWFGDLEAYRKSTVKMITVGINPSKDEFQSEAKDKIPENSFFRFSGWKEKGMTSEEYFNGMKQYFRNKPYWKWFELLANAVNLENVWNASYSAGDTQSTVLHIDFCTPCATTPTWTGENKTTKEKLPLSVKKKLTEIQDKYFETLYHFLKPEIVFIGSAQFDEFQQHEKFTLLADMDGGNPLYQKLSSMISNLKNLDGNPHGNRRQLKFWSASDGTIFVSGQYRGNPFGAYTQDGLREIMREFIRVAKTDPNSI